jgi:hypothetical protein
VGMASLLSLVRTRVDVRCRSLRSRRRTSTRKAFWRTIEYRRSDP